MSRNQEIGDHMARKKRLMSAFRKGEGRAEPDTPAGKQNIRKK